MDKEQAYDKKIYPLMQKIIAICEKHKIAHLCHFELGGEGLDLLCCTTVNTTADREPSMAILNAVKAVYPTPSEIIENCK